MNENNAREEFLKKYKANLREIRELDKVLNISDYLPLKDKMSKSQIDAVVKEISESMDGFKIKQRQSDKKRRLKISKAKEKAKFIGNIKRTVVGLLLAGATLVGGYQVKNAYDTYQQQNEPIGIGQALEENGETITSLGLNNNIVLEMQDIEKEIERGDLTNKEIIELAPRVEKVQSDILDMKLAKALEVSEDDIDYSTRNIEEGMTRETVTNKKDKTNYVNEDFFERENTFPKVISDNIKEIDKMSTVVEGDFNRNEVLEKYRNSLKHASQLAASNIKLDKEKNNIVVEQTKVADLNKNKEESEELEL